MPALRQKELVQKFLEEVKSAKDGILYCSEYINFKFCIQRGRRTQLYSPTPFYA